MPSGALYHVMGRGMEGSSIFRSNDDREDFLTRLGFLCEGELLSVHAWALLGSHFHLLIRTGRQRISAINLLFLTVHKCLRFDFDMLRLNARFLSEIVDLGDRPGVMTRRF